MDFISEATTLGALTFTTGTPGTFKAELGSPVPEPTTAIMIALALVVAALIHRSRPLCCLHSSGQPPEGAVALPKHGR
jgi:hypothetical protein